MRKLTLILSLIIFSCSKDNGSNCENWRVQEWVKEGNTTLVDTHTKETKVCNEDIKPAGTTYIYHQEGNVKYYRKMIEKI